MTENVNPIIPNNLLFTNLPQENQLCSSDELFKLNNFKNEIIDVVSTNDEPATNVLQVLQPVNSNMTTPTLNKKKGRRSRKEESPADDDDDGPVVEVTEEQIESGDGVFLDAMYGSYAAFERAFINWKRKHLHPFRVASSETLKDTAGNVEPTYRYRYAVFHCAHYGEPRMRGSGKRPNQSYLPCGCQAMLRLNYKFNKRILKVTTLVDEHTGHVRTEEQFMRTNVKKPSPTLKTPGVRGRKRQNNNDHMMPMKRSCEGLDLSQTNGLLSTPFANPLLYQQQLFNMFLQPQVADQKDGSINANMFNFLNLQNMMGMTPSAPSPCQPTPTKTEFNLPTGIPAPQPIRVTHSPPPVLVAEKPIKLEVTEHKEMASDSPSSSSSCDTSAETSKEPSEEPKESQEEDNQTSVRFQLQQVIKDLYDGCQHDDVTVFASRIEILKKIRDQWKH